MAYFGTQDTGPAYIQMRLPLARDPWTIHTRRKRHDREYRSETVQVFMGTTSCLSSMLVSSTPALEGAGVAIDRSGLPTATQLGKA